MLKGVLIVILTFLDMKTILGIGYLCLFWHIVIDDFLYIQFPTRAPTNKPTHTPTDYPSFASAAGTENPTIFPTNNYSTTETPTTDVR